METVLSTATAFRLPEKNDVSGNLRLNPHGEPDIAGVLSGEIELADVMFRLTVVVDVICDDVGLWILVISRNPNFK